LHPTQVSCKLNANTGADDIVAIARGPVMRKVKYDYVNEKMALFQPRIECVSPAVAYRVY